MFFKNFFYSVKYYKNNYNVEPLIIDPNICPQIIPKNEKEKAHILITKLSVLNLILDYHQPI